VDVVPPVDVEPPVDVPPDVEPPVALPPWFVEAPALPPGASAPPRLSGEELDEAQLIPARSVIPTNPNRSLLEQRNMTDPPGGLCLY